MHDFEKSKKLANMAHLIHEGQDMTFTWQVEEPHEVTCQQPETINMDDTVGIVTAIKEKLDIINAAFSNAACSPQLNYIKTLLTAELMSINLTLDSHLAHINNAVSLQQQLTMGDLRNIQFAGQQAIVSIPLN